MGIFRSNSKGYGRLADLELRGRGMVAGRFSFASHHIRFFEEHKLGNANPAWFTSNDVVSMRLMLTYRRSQRK
jgi:hypothetical protein